MSNVAVAPPPFQQPPPPGLEPKPGLKEYTVARGDSFYTIGKAHGVSMAAIAKANPNVDSRRLKVGQVLQIPEPTAPSSQEAMAAGDAGTLAVYIVKPGDTLTGIARQHGTTIKAIRTANNLKTDRLVVGQKLKIPEGKPAAAPAAPGSTPAGVMGNSPVFTGSTPQVNLPPSTSPQ
jgi:LysM repeat protein